MKDKKEALTTAKEVATKLENEKKVRYYRLSPVRLFCCSREAQWLRLAAVDVVRQIVKQWIAKHGTKDREATAQKAEADKQKAEVIKLQSQVTKLQTEKAAAVRFSVSLIVRATAARE